MNPHQQGPERFNLILAQTDSGYFVDFRIDRVQLFFKRLGIRRKVNVGLAAVIRPLFPLDETARFQTAKRNHGGGLAHPDALAQFPLGNPILEPKLAKKTPLACRDTMFQGAAFQHA